MEKPGNPFLFLNVTHFVGILLICMKILGNPFLFVKMSYTFGGMEKPGNPFVFVKISYTFCGNPFAFDENPWKSFSLRENLVRYIME